MNQKIPKFIYPYLWFNDISKMDLKKHKHRIILNVLDFGSKEATDWLFKMYPIKEIKEIIIKKGHELSKKSLNYWCLILKINKKEIQLTRF